MSEHDGSAIDQLFQSFSGKDIVERRCEVTRNSGLYAPFGKGFQMSGKFWLDGIFAEPWRDIRPVRSLELYIEPHREEYFWLLDEFGGDKERALEAYNEDFLSFDDFFDEYHPEVFVGKWLSRSQSNPAEIKVLSEPNIFMRESNSLVITDLGQGLLTNPIIVDGIDPGEVSWQQDIATGILGDCSVELIDIEEEPPSLFIPEKKKPEIEHVHELRAPTVDEYDAYFNFGVDEHWTEQQRLAFMRAQRRKRIPLSDDPLRDFIFPELLVYPEKVPLHLPEPEVKRWIITPKNKRFIDRDIEF